MNGLLDLCIITRGLTQPHSEIYWGYFRRLVLGNSLTKHNKLSSFSYSVVIFFLPLSHIPPCYRTKPPDVCLSPVKIGMGDVVHVMDSGPMMG